MLEACRVFAPVVPCRFHASACGLQIPSAKDASHGEGINEMPIRRAMCIGTNCGHKTTSFLLSPMSQSNSTANIARLSARSTPIFRNLSSIFLLGFDDGQGQTFVIGNSRRVFNSKRNTSPHPPVHGFRSNEKRSNAAEAQSVPWRRAQARSIGSKFLR